jgi:hypothetical protein
MYKNNTGSFNKNPYEKLSIAGLKQAEEIMSQTADWFKNELDKFEEESKILESPDCEYAQAEAIRKKTGWFQRRREFELDQLEKYKAAKDKILLAHLLSGVNNIKL